MAEFVNSTGKTALLIGVGGIGGNVYPNELRALGYLLQLLTMLHKQTHPLTT